MKVTALETIQLESLPMTIWLRIYTDGGIVGLGESAREPATIAEYIHTSVAGYLLGKDPLAIEKHNRFLLSRNVGFAGTAAEVRAASAVDLALWDILGQATNQPIHQLLGGLSRDCLPVYNTCASFDYHMGPARNQTSRQVAKGETSKAPQGVYDDQVLFMNCADELAHSLIEEGYKAMKIWPLDPQARATGGNHISTTDLNEGIEPFEKIRKAVGDKIDVLCELHSLWNLPSAMRIARALEPYAPFWIEDPLDKMNNVAALAELARYSRIPVAGGENLSHLTMFRDHLAAGGLHYVIADLEWCGGLTQARKIAALAEAYQRPLALHDCLGPVSLAASVHLALHAPNVPFQEVVRSFIASWYKDVATNIPRIFDGHIYPLTGPGLGTALMPDIVKRPDAIVRRTSLT